MGFCLFNNVAIGVAQALAEHGADMDMPRVTFDTGFDAIAAWTPLSTTAMRTVPVKYAAGIPVFTS